MFKVSLSIGIVSRRTEHNHNILITYKVVSHSTEICWNQLGLKAHKTDKFNNLRLLSLLIWSVTMQGKKAKEIPIYRECHTLLS